MRENSVLYEEPDKENLQEENNMPKQNTLFFSSFQSNTYLKYFYCCCDISYRNKKKKDC